MSERPQNIGIKAIELYFPSQVCFLHQSLIFPVERLLTISLQCVDQAELEKFDGVSQGKYTIGLGQTKMSFCDDREGECPLPIQDRFPPLGGGWIR
jgi:hydroxymethylglutaryl-CoA synthase